MNKRLAPFVSRLAAELADTPGSHWTSIDGSMLSCDISGFTALSERLATKGKSGAEELLELINLCFATLMDHTYAHGGEVLTFGGDAMLVLFRASGHRRRSVTAAQLMQQSLRTLGAARRFKLTMTVGVAEGPFDVFLAGSSRREILIAGHRATEVIRLETEAAHGETLVTPGIASVIPSDLLGRRHAGALAVVGQTGDRPKPDSAAVTWAPELASLVSTEVVDELSAFAAYGGEHRLACTNFVHVGGVTALIDERGPDWVAAAFGDLVDGISDVIQRFGVSLLHSDIAAGGVKLLLAAGAPISGGNNADAMLRAALDLVGLETPFELRQGVQTGHVFAGFIGSSWRRTYTLMGDPVNTAARMLGAADDGDIIAVSGVPDEARTAFAVEKLAPFMVKGKAEPISAVRILTTSPTSRSAESGRPLFGRRAEVESVVGLLETTAKVVELVGPAGIGKSRLLAEVLDLVTTPTTVRASCTPYGVTSPYSVFRPLLRQTLGIESPADPSDVGTVLETYISEHSPGLEPMVPLLAVPFGAVVSPTAESDAIDPGFRRQRIYELIVDFLDMRFDGPVLMALEDLHWADDASAELVNHLARAVADRNWGLIVTRRPEGVSPLDSGSGVTTVTLDALEDNEIRSLAIDSSDRPLSNAELETVIERSRGNPFFAVELTRAIDTARELELPSSVEALISDRVDQLSPEARRLIRIASVFGDKFFEADLRAIAPTDVDADAAWGQLREILLPGRDGVVSFAHAMYRDAAYEGLPYRERRRLHRIIGQKLEAETDDPSQIADLLAVHFDHAGDRHRTWHFGCIGGRNAAAQYAPVEAISAFRRALDAARRLPEVSAKDRSAVAIELGDAAERSGRYDVAKQAYDLAGRLLDSDDAGRSSLCLKRGVISEREGNYSNAIRWYRRGVRASTVTKDELVELHLAEAGVRFRQGRYRDCWSKALPIADQTDLSPRSRLRACSLLQLSGIYLNEPAAQDYGERGLQLAPEVKDPVLEGNLLNNLGMAAYYGGDWDRSASLYQRSYELRDGCGDVTGALMAANNIGELRSDQGRLDEAEQLFVDALRRSRASGYEMATAVISSNLGRLAYRRGELGAAGPLLESAAEDFDRMGAAGLALETTQRQLELELRQCAYDHVHATARELLEGDAIDVGGQATEIALRRLIGTAARHLGDDRLARKELEIAAALARYEDLKYELAVALEELGRLVGDPIASEARELFERMGVRH